MRIRITKRTDTRYDMVVWTEFPEQGIFRPSDHSLGWIATERDLDMIQAAIDLARSGSRADLRSAKANPLKQYEDEHLTPGQFIYSPTD